MDYVLVAFLVLVLLGVRPYFGKWKEVYVLENGTELDYLSVENTLPLRGILAITIILHHMSERVEGGAFFPLLLHAGYLGVGVFFFLSGYGLMVQYKKKGKDYLQGFWKKRIGYLLIVYLIATVVYAVVEWLIGEEITLQKVLLSLINGKMTASNSWYIYIQIALYIIFWISFKYVKNNKRAIFLVFVLETALIPLLILWGRGSIWYMSNYPFVAGLIWAEEKERIDEILKKRWCLCLVAVAVLFAVFSGLPLVTESFGLTSDTFKVICRMISTPVLAVMCVVILNKVWIKGKLWRFLGEISLEIYIIHGLVIMTLHSGYIYIQNDVLWTLLIVVFSVGVAYIASRINRLIKSITK